MILPTEEDARHHARIVAAYLDEIVKQKVVDIFQAVSLAQVYSGLIVGKFFDNQMIQQQQLSYKNDLFIEGLQKETKK